MEAELCIALYTIFCCSVCCPDKKPLTSQEPVVTRNPGTSGSPKTSGTPGSSMVRPNSVYESPLKNQS
uniref:Uncharacterized protein n=1 Tax=viral metagenome TaxID=1070528 RepID=A0A6C0AMB3_9ZZZZ